MQFNTKVTLRNIISIYTTSYIRPKLLGTYIFFVYLEFFYLYFFTGIIHKFLKQRIIYSKCHKSIFELKY